MIQPKYTNKSFQEILEESQELVNLISEYFQSYGGNVRKYLDAEPFCLPDGSKVRGLDLLIFIKGKSILVDAKDFGKFKKYNATGLPINMMERYRKMKKTSGLDCYLFFRDNKEIEKTYESKFKKNGIFIPYGNEIDLLVEDDDLSKNRNFKCKWKGQYENELQEIWNIDKMKSIEEILKNWNKLSFGISIKKIKQPETTTQQQPLFKLSYD